MTGEKATMDAPQIYVERTLAIVKPDAIHKSEEIEDIILRSGFAILQVILETLVKQITEISSNFLYTEYVYYAKQINIIMYDVFSSTEKACTLNTRTS